MNFVTLSVNGDEYLLKATTLHKVAAEKKLGMSLLKAMQNVDESEAFAQILWAALQKMNHGMNINAVYDLIDAMEENGYTMNGQAHEGLSFSDRADICLEICKVSGYFTKDEVIAMEEGTKEAKPRPKRKPKVQQS